MKRLLIILFLVVLIINGCSNNSDSKNEQIEFTPYNPPKSTAITKRSNTEDILEAFDRAARKDVPEKQMKIIKEFYDTDNIPQDKDVIADLMEHPEIIPYKGILGGTVAFNEEKNIAILLDNYVFACFDDGHIPGALLLKYKKEGTKITWEVIDKYISQ